MKNLGQHYFKFAEKGLGDEAVVCTAHAILTARCIHTFLTQCRLSVSLCKSMCG